MVEKASGSTEAKATRAVLLEDFTKGLWRDHPLLVPLGTCPTLAVTTTVVNGFAMGMATGFVLVCSCVVVSFIRKLIPQEVRIAAFTMIIAAFVTLADLFLKANFYAISKALGPFVPLIVVNCIILGRQEAFASKHGPVRSGADALGMGAGFLLLLLLLGGIREVFGSRTLLGWHVPGVGAWFPIWVVMILPAGAFITLGIIIGVAKQMMLRQQRLRSRGRGTTEPGAPAA
jgi:electron transport complex protein RnfE